MGHLGRSKNYKEDRGRNEYSAKHYETTSTCCI
jgi:hypothetical protein